MSMRDLKRISQNGWVRTSTFLIALPVMILAIAWMTTRQVNATSCDGPGPSTGPECEERTYVGTCDASTYTPSYPDQWNVTQNPAFIVTSSVDTSASGCEGAGLPSLDTPEYEILPGKYEHVYYTCEASTDGGEDSEYRNVDVYTVDYQLDGTPAWSPSTVQGSTTTHEYEVKAKPTGSLPAEVSFPSSISVVAGTAEISSAGLIASISGAGLTANAGNAIEKAFLTPGESTVITATPTQNGFADNQPSWGVENGTATLSPNTGDSVTLTAPSDGTYGQIDVYATTRCGEDTAWAALIFETVELVDITIPNNEIYINDEITGITPTFTNNEYSDKSQLEYKFVYLDMEGVWHEDESWISGFLSSVSKSEPGFYQIMARFSGSSSIVTSQFFSVHKLVADFPPTNTCPTCDVTVTAELIPPSSNYPTTITWDYTPPPNSNGDPESGTATSSATAEVTVQLKKGTYNIDVENDISSNAFLSHTVSVPVDPGATSTTILDEQRAKSHFLSLMSSTYVQQVAEKMANGLPDNFQTTISGFNQLLFTKVHGNTCCDGSYNSPYTIWDLDFGQSNLKIKSTPFYWHVNFTEKIRQKFYQSEGVQDLAQKKQKLAELIQEMQNELAEYSSQIAILQARIEGIESDIVAAQEMLAQTGLDPSVRIYWETRLLELQVYLQETQGFLADAQYEIFRINQFCEVWLINLDNVEQSWINLVEQYISRLQLDLSAELFDIQFNMGGQLRTKSYTFSCPSTNCLFMIQKGQATVDLSCANTFGVNALILSGNATLTLSGNTALNCQMVAIPVDPNCEGKNVLDGTWGYSIDYTENGVWRDILFGEFTDGTQQININDTLGSDTGNIDVTTFDWPYPCAGQCGTSGVPPHGQ